MTFTVIDGVLTLTVLICAIIGVARGFFATLSKPVRIIASVCLTFCIASPIISAWTGPYFINRFSMSIEEYLIANCGNITAENALNSLPTLLKLFAFISGVELGSDLENMTGADIISNLAEKLGAAVGNAVAVAVTYLGLFIILSLLLGVVLSVFNKIFSSGVLGVINKILGLIFGLSIGVVLSCLIASIVSNVSPDFLGGFVYDFFKTFNPLSFILSF